uniref:Uncharacterized protein n=1 Tax=Amphimedon queenslandica TaxID=400682 RepID=A0A1X7TZC2_AMPQE
MAMLLLQAVFFSLFFVREVYSEIEVVPCNHNTSVCECKTTNPNDVCEFTLDIEMLQTFTRYLLDGTGNSRGTAGSVWCINNEGEWERVDPEDTLCGSSIDSTNCTQPFGVDGYTFRSFIAVNGRIPGPTLIVTEGQLVKVNVINRLASESVSVHWHGMHQRNSNWMDGVEHVTQCGIPPGASFSYFFYATQYGTHWYHSHSGAQRTDGLFGALIVKEKQDNPQYTAFMKKLNEMGIQENTYVDNPNEHTLTLLDWQKSNSLDLFTQIHSSIRYFNIDEASELVGANIPRTRSSDGAEIGPVPYWSGLINGRGRHNDTDYSNSILSDFNVTAGNMYRFRLIGAQSLYAYRFSIEQHDLTVIATDGQFIEPETVDYIIIHSGERYDFLLEAKEENENQRFMIRAVTLSFTETSTYLEEQSAEAILNYRSTTTLSSDYAGIAASSQNVSKRCNDNKPCQALNCPFKNFPEQFNIKCIHIHNLTRLSSDMQKDLPDVATSDNSRLFFNFGFEGTRLTSAVNARNLKLPSASLAQLEANKLNDINGTEFCKDLNKPNTCNRDNGNEVISPKCYCTHVVDVEANKYIELVISATGPDYDDVNPRTSKFLFAHPVHLHGHYFHVVDIRFGRTDEDSGRLTAGNSDINCGGDTLCTMPRWKPDKDYSSRTGMTSKIPSTAPLKDTLLIPAGGYAVVYFKTDNPGWWFLHCHIEVHQLEGMGVIINEKGKKTPPPDSMFECGNFSLTEGKFKAAISATASPTPTLTTTTIETTATTIGTTTAQTPTGTSDTNPTTNSGGGGGGCFPLDAVVRTRNGPLLMKNVEIGMELLAVSSNHKLVYSPVILIKQKQGIAWYPSMLQSLGKVFLDDSNYKPMKVEDLIKSSD